MVQNATSLLCAEDGCIGNLNISGRLVTLEPVGEALVVGDLHGDLTSLITILRNSSFIQKLSANKDAIVVFLGDYGDRGGNSAEVYYIILKLKLAFPKQIVLLRGNHEGPVDLMASPHDLPLQFQDRFEGQGNEAYQNLQKLFTCLYTAVLVPKRYLMVHGGLSPNLSSASDLANAHLTHPKLRLLEDLLWSDPSDIVENISPSPRGAGSLFSKRVTEKALGKLGVHILVRGHEPSGNGFKVNHDGKVLTLFSRTGAPYFNRYGAYLNISLSQQAKNVKQLLPYVIKF